MIRLLKDKIYDFAFCPEQTFKANNLYGMYFTMNGLLIHVFKFLNLRIYGLLSFYAQSFKALFKWHD